VLQPTNLKDGIGRVKHVLRNIFASGSAAVEHTFVQFYPTLKQVAKKFGTYRDAAENVSLAASDHGPWTHRLRSTDMYGMIVKVTAPAVIAARYANWPCTPILSLRIPS